MAEVWRAVVIGLVFSLNIYVRSPHPWEYLLAGLLCGGNLGMWAGRHSSGR